MAFERSFVQTSRAWYADNCLSDIGRDMTEEIILTVASAGGSDNLEFCIRWYRLAGQDVPRLEVFSESFSALRTCGDFMDGFEELCRGRSARPAEAVQLLASLDFVDKTAERDPYGRTAGDIRRGADPGKAAGLRAPGLQPGVTG